jgi:hypothetical protein
MELHAASFIAKGFARSADKTDRRTYTVLLFTSLLSGEFQPCYFMIFMTLFINFIAQTK